MATPPTHIRGIVDCEPQVLLQTQTSDFVKATLRTAYDYIETQFLTVDRNYLQQNDLSLKDMYLMDKIYMQSSALPYFLTRVSARKQMMIENSTVDKENQLSIKKNFVNTNGLQNGKDRALSTSFKSNNNHSNHRQLIGLSSTNTNTALSTRNDTSSFLGDGNKVIIQPKNNVLQKMTKPNLLIKTGNIRQRETNSDFVVSSREYSIENSTIPLCNGDNPRGNNKSPVASKRENITNRVIMKETSRLDSTGPGVSARITSEENNKTPAVGTNDSKEKNSSPVSSRETSRVIKTGPVVSTRITSEENNKTPAVGTNDSKEKNSNPLSTRETSKVIKTDPVVSTTAPVSTKKLSLVATETTFKGYDVVFGDFVNGVYYVTNQDSMSNVEEIHHQLKNEKLNTWSIESGEKKVAFVLDGKYYRGLIVENNVPGLNGSSFIKLVDIGWFVSFDSKHSSNLYLLPEKFSKNKPLAFAICTKHSTPIPRCTRVTIVETGEMIGKAKKVTVTQVHPITTGEINQPQPLSKPSVHQGLVEQQANATLHTLSTNVPVNVIWIQREENSEDVHWVQDETYYTKYEEWQKSSIAQPSLNKMPQLGDLCLKTADGEWCRCRVESLEPLTVFYIDFGSLDMANSYKELKHLSSDMASVQPLAYKIKFYNAENNKIEYNFGDSFKITPICESDLIYTVLKDKEISNVSETLIKKDQKSNCVNGKNMVIKTNVHEEYEYKNAAISSDKVELNKRIEVNYIQDDEINGELKWVQDVQFAETLLEWQEIVDNFNVPFMSNATKPGDFCVKLYDDMWCRAKIVSCDPLTLFYIDFGNNETVDNHKEIKYLPPQLSEVRPLAMKVQFFHNINNIPNEYENSFFITPIEKKDDVLVVLRDDEKIEPKEDNHAPIKYYYKEAGISQPCSLEINKPIEVSFIQNDPENESQKWVQDSMFYTYIEDWTNVCDKIKKSFEQKPSVGEFCVHLYDESWCRGQVTQVDPDVSVFYIDFGNIELVSNPEELKPLPSELSVVQPLAHKVQFLHKKSAEINYNFGDTFNITPLETKDDVVVVLKDDETLEDTKSLVYNSPFVCLELNKPVKAAWLQDDEFDSQYTWVQDMTHFDQTEVIIKELTEFTEKCTQLPQVGYLCGKVYEDVWCRAKVVSTNPLTIFYIDYGNTEEVKNLEELKPLPDNLVKYPGFAYLIRFENSKPDLSFGDVFTFTPISLDGNVYTASI